MLNSRYDKAQLTSVFLLLTPAWAQVRSTVSFICVHICISAVVASV